MVITSYLNYQTHIIGSTQTIAYAVLREHVKSVLEEFDLTVTSWSMIGVVSDARDGIRPAEVARVMNVKAPLITLLTRDIEARGIIQINSNQVDARAKLLSVTPKGKKIVRSINSKLNTVLQPLLSGLDDKDIQAYYKVLTTIVENGNSAKQSS
jgi:DNA-binding MarR family transcriptional regulator